MANIDDFMNEVSPEVSGCPEPSIIIAIRNSITEFCEKSLYWAVNLDPIDVVAGTHTYALESSESDSLVAGILVANYAGKPMAPTSEDKMDLEWGSDDPWREETSEAPTQFLHPTPREIRLIGIPTESLVGGLTIKAGLKPSPQGEDVGDIIHEDYHEAVAWGALYRLMMQAGKKWSDKKAAIDYKSLFDQKIEEAKGRRLASHSRQDQVVIRTKSYY